jgi:hypothetical protein
MNGRIASATVTPLLEYGSIASSNKVDAWRNRIFTQSIELAALLPSKDKALYS